MKICERITCDSFVLTGASVIALINSSIRRYLCGITQLKLNEAIMLVQKLNEAIVLARLLRQNNSPTLRLNYCIIAIGFTNLSRTHLHAPLGNRCSDIVRFPSFFKKTE